MASDIALPKSASWVGVFAATAAGLGLLLLPAAWAIRGRWLQSIPALSIFGFEP